MYCVSTSMSTYSYPYQDLDPQSGCGLNQKFNWDVCRTTFKINSLGYSFCLYLPATFYKFSLFYSTSEKFGYIYTFMGFLYFDHFLHCKIILKASKLWNDIMCINKRFIIIDSSKLSAFSLMTLALHTNGIIVARFMR